MHHPANVVLAWCSKLAGAGAGASVRALSLSTLRLSTLGLCALSMIGCASATTTDGAEPLAATPQPISSSEDPLALEYDASAFQAQTKLLDKLRSNPFAYFRYVAAPFVRTVCESEIDPTTPIVALHGDLHLEQYAVANDGFGIVDFDDATKGPAVLDWLRFTTSLWIAMKGDEAATTKAIDRFVEGYRVALANPDAVTAAPEPVAAKRVRDSCTATNGEWLDHVQSFMQPLDSAGVEKMKAARKLYIDAMLTQNPDLNEGFFALKAGGALNMGIGSAHETKFLVRVEGPTSSPDDDVILEKKQMKSHLFGRCVSGDDTDPARVIAAQKKFSRSPQRLLGYVVVEGVSYYVQAWRVHYTELKVADLKSASELAEVAFDVGLQLGRGHPLLPFDSTSGKHERARLREALDTEAPRLAEQSRELAERTQRGYERFRAASLTDTKSVDRKTVSAR